MTVYAGVPVCAAAKAELAHSGPQAGSVRVRLFCTRPVETKGRLDLAAAGADARRAVEDSRTIGYIEARGPVTPFIRPILEEPEIALITDSSGAHGMAKVLDALRSRGDSETPREAVWERW